MSLGSQTNSIAHLLPESHVGKVNHVERLSLGLSGAAVYAISSSRGELVLRIHALSSEPSSWTQQLTVLRRAAASGIAPAIVHVDEAARAVVSERVVGAQLAAALGDADQRGAAIASVVDQLRTLHRLDSSGIEERDAVVFARERYTTQRARPGFPAWASALEPILEAASVSLARDPRRVVSHNDMNPGNILWDGKRAWLIDWEVAGLTHPFYDLAVLAMFLQLPAAAAQHLLALQEQQTVDEAGFATFASLRQLAALLCGTVFMSLVPDLSILPESPLSLSEVYAAMHAGQLDLQSARGQAAFATALLRLCTNT